MEERAYVRKYLRSAFREMYERGEEKGGTFCIEDARTRKQRDLRGNALQDPGPRRAARKVLERRCPSCIVPFTPVMKQFRR